MHERWGPRFQEGIPQRYITKDTLPEGEICFLRQVLNYSSGLHLIPLQRLSMVMSCLEYQEVQMTTQDL